MPHLTVRRFSFPMTLPFWRPPWASDRADHAHNERYINMQSASLGGKNLMDDLGFFTMSKGRVARNNLSVIGLVQFANKDKVKTRTIRLKSPTVLESVFEAGEVFASIEKSQWFNRSTPIK